MRLVTAVLTGRLGLPFSGDALEHPFLRSEVDPQARQNLGSHQIAGILRDQSQDEHAVASQVALDEPLHRCNVDRKFRSIDLIESVQLPLDEAILQRPGYQSNEPAKESDRRHDADDDEPEPDDGEDLLVE